MSMRTTSSRWRRGLAATSVAGLALLTACSSGEEAAEGSSTTAEQENPPEGGSRLAVSYEGGVLVLDGTSLETIADLESEEFTRLNPAGDGRHVMVTTSEGFQVLDAGTDGSQPELTDKVFEADTAGHVVSHAGKTVLYADGTSDTTIFDTAALADSGDELPETETVEGVEAHHGVSLVLEDGTFLTTLGNAEVRSGVVAQDADGEVIATNEECPGVHGEGTAADEVVVFGCEDGALLYADGAFEKLDAPDQPYGRMGNAFVTDTSPLVLGDYKSDPDAEGYLLDRVEIIDTQASTLEVVPMPAGAEYTFRDLARGADDRGYVLASDGAIHVLDLEAGEFVDSYPVVEPWEGPAEWQDPHPAIRTDGDLAYVTEPATNEVHVVDLTTGEVTASTTLDVVPNELGVATG